MERRAEFERLARGRLGATAAARVLWSGPRLICSAGKYTRPDVHAVREHRRSIDSVRYRLFGSDLLGFEAVDSVRGRPPAVRGAGLPWLSSACTTGRISICGTSPASSLPQKTKLLVYLKADPRQVDLLPGFTRDVMGLGQGSARPTVAQCRRSATSEAT
ncbi:hypothetical protein [Streptomyces sp. TLI_185]|uniref:hypothetical protein n=1 Tax=Streptomyces sp. TLI_185 TaxID=2485151 RepID=UPI0026CC9B11